MTSGAPAGAPGCIALLTDYGRDDEFAGVLHATLARLAPSAPVVDLTHEIAPFDVRAGALALERSMPHLGPGVVVGVVDPGVGSRRRRLALALPTSVSVGPGHLVGPDNGLLGWAADAAGGVTAAVALDPARLAALGFAGPAPAPSTFDGRDVFAPAAAALWRGIALEELGEPVDPAGLVRLLRPRLSAGPGVLEAEVLWVDRFGNAQLAARPADAARSGLDEPVELVVEIVVEADARRRHVRRVPAFSALAPGEVGLVEDANGHLALVCDRQPAATVLGVQPGDVVVVRRRSS